VLEGQALFHVVKEPARPFVVTSGGIAVRAVGTQFDVYKKRDGTVVTVVEGQVAIVGNGAAAARETTGAHSRTSIPSSTQDGENEYQQAVGTTLLVSAGRQVIVRRASVEEAANPNIAGAIAWRQRQLVFESASLSQVAEEFNRYNTRQLVIWDAELYEFHISGVFSSTDPASLVRFLRERPGVHVIETEAEIRVTKSSR
jgi:transmembrane sensor